MVPSTHVAFEGRSGSVRRKRPAAVGPPATAPPTRPTSLRRSSWSEMATVDGQVRTRGCRSRPCAAGLVRHNSSQHEFGIFLCVRWAQRDNSGHSGRSEVHAATSCDAPVPLLAVANLHESRSHTSPHHPLTRSLPSLHTPIILPPSPSPHPQHTIGSLTSDQLRPHCVLFVSYKYGAILVRVSLSVAQ